MPSHLPTPRSRRLRCNIAARRRRCARCAITTALCVAILGCTARMARGHPADEANIAFATSENASGAGFLLGTEIGANVRYGSPPADKGGCHWHHVVDTDTLTGVYGPISRMMGTDMYSLFERECDGPPATSRQFWVRDESHVSLASRASRRVTARLPQPLYGLAPASRLMVVNVGTWFWISPSIWKERSITAYLVTPEGVVWVKTTATPVRALYLPGDGSGRTIGCKGPGRRWQSSFGDRLGSPCMYTYAHASNQSRRGTFLAKVGIEWHVSWTSNLGMEGVFPNVRTLVPVRVQVREIQALATN